MRAGPRPRNAREDTLGNAIYKVFRRRANPGVKQVSVERSLLKKTSAEKNLRFRRDHDTSLHPCVKESQFLAINQTHGVKEHVCFKTTNLGCKPVNGKFLCEKMLSMYRDSANKTQAYTSGCRCVNPKIPFPITAILYLEALVFLDIPLAPFFCTGNLIKISK